MQLGFIGLGRMGANMVKRLTRAGHRCVVFDIDRKSVDALVAVGATAAPSLEGLAGLLEPPRAVWMMLPAALVDQELATLAPTLGDGDMVVDGGNSYFHDDIRRSGE